MRLLDGGTLSAPVIGQYCSHVTGAGLTVVSSGRDLMLLFHTDRHTDTQTVHNDSSITAVHRAGFHAVFSFVPRLQNDSSRGSAADQSSSRYVDVAQQAPGVHWSSDDDYAFNDALGIPTSAHSTTRASTKVIRQKAASPSPRLFSPAPVWD